MAGPHLMTEPSPSRQFSIVLRASADVADPLRALKAVLQYAGHLHGMRCMKTSSVASLCADRR